MNEWVNESIKLAKSEGYLDRLLAIYPPEEISRGKIPEEESQELKDLFERKGCKELLKKLIDLKKKCFKFPIENPYIGFLTHDEEAIEKNPDTTKKICEKLFQMGYDEVKEKLESPKRASRRMGPMFKKWLENNFKFLKRKEFEKTFDFDIVFLKGGDKSLKDYAKTKLKCKFQKFSKGLDFVAKVGNKHIIGTAKFITDFGGSQDNQFNEAIRLVKETKGPPNVIKVAILDGVVWLSEEMKSKLKNLKENEFFFSALLLEKFINFIKQTQKV